MKWIFQVAKASAREDQEANIGCQGSILLIKRYHDLHWSVMKSKECIIPLAQEHD